MKYTIYSHSDSDGGIAAALLARHIVDTYGAHGWEVEINPLNHGSNKGDWSFREIAWPSAILDFTIHPRFFDKRFFQQRETHVAKLGAEKIPPCYWLDHHPTGSSYEMLTAENLTQSLPNVTSVWDVSAVSTPGLMRTHFEKIGFARKLVEDYEMYIDVAEIIDGALFATAEAAHDFSAPAVKLQTLFNPSHSLVDRQALYRQLVQFIMRNPNVEDIFDADPIFSGLLAHEEQLTLRRKTFYEKHTKKIGNTAICNFVDFETFEGMARFMPYLVCPDAEYAIHVLPKQRGTAMISCGINPWNKPEKERHLGNYFAQNFDGGGHAFVAGGKVQLDRLDAVDKLVEFLQG